MCLRSKDAVVVVEVGTGMWMKTMHTIRMRTMILEVEEMKVQFHADLDQPGASVQTVVCLKIGDAVVEVEDGMMNMMMKMIMSMKMRKRRRTTMKVELEADLVSFHADRDQSGASVPTDVCQKTQDVAAEMWMKTMTMITMITTMKITRTMTMVSEADLQQSHACQDKSGA